MAEIAPEELPLAPLCMRPCSPTNGAALGTSQCSLAAHTMHPAHVHDQEVLIA